jgi:peptidyl-prolyl cis-trans isomerase D
MFHIRVTDFIPGKALNTKEKALMLKFMRDHLGKTFLFVIVGAISAVFVITGVFTGESRFGRGASGGVAVSVDGEPITAKDIQDAVERDVQNYRAMGMELPPELLEQVRMGALQGLVKNKLMLVEARRLGVQASEKEVMEEIRQQPFFQNKEKKEFDVDLYRKLLTANGLSPGLYEEQVRNQLTNQRLVKFLEGRIRVTPLEVEREYKLTNDTRNVEFVRFSRDDAIKKIRVDPKEVDKLLADKTREGQVAGFYASNNARYNKQEQVCARHILKRAEGKDADAKTPPKEFLALRPSPANFAKIAEKSSEDPGSKAKGGDLGCFARGAMDKAFEEAAFSTPVGKISAPVQSQFGWHYIYPYKKEAALSTPLEKVKREIAEEILKRDRLDEIRKINLAAAEEAMKRWPPKGLESTGAFNSLEGQIPKIGRAEEIMKAAFDANAKIQKGPQLFEAAGGVIVAQVKEAKTADMAKLSQERGKQEQTLRERKLRAFLPAWLEDVQKRTNVSFNKNVVGEM